MSVTGTITSSILMSIPSTLRVPSGRSPATFVRTGEHLRHPRPRSSAISGDTSAPGNAVAAHEPSSVDEDPSGDLAVALPIRPLRREQRVIGFRLDVAVEIAG